MSLFKLYLASINGLLFSVTINNCLQYQPADEFSVKFIVVLVMRKKNCRVYACKRGTGDRDISVQYNEGVERDREVVQQKIHVMRMGNPISEVPLLLSVDSIDLDPYHG